MALGGLRVDSSGSVMRPEVITSLLQGNRKSGCWEDDSPLEECVRDMRSVPPVSEWDFLRIFRLFAAIDSDFLKGGYLPQKGAKGAESIHEMGGS